MKKVLFPSLIVVMVLLSSAMAFADNVFIHPDTIYTSRLPDHSDSTNFYIVNTTDSSVDFSANSYPYWWIPEPSSGTISPNDSALIMITVHLTDWGGYCLYPGVEDYLYIFDTSDPIDSVISVVLIDTVLLQNPPTINVISPVGGEHFFAGDTLHCMSSKEVGMMW